MKNLEGRNCCSSLPKGAGTPLPMTSQFFLTFLLVTTAFASNDIPDKVQMKDLREEYLNVRAQKSAQSERKRIAATNRLKRLWEKAREQAKGEFCTHWSAKYAVDRVKKLLSYDNAEFDESELTELQYLKEQLDESGCCALLPESNWYPAQN